MSSVTKMVILKICILLILNTNSALSVRCYTCDSPLDLNLNCEKLDADIPRLECPSPNVCGSFVLGTPGTDILHRGCYPENHCQSLESKYANNPAVDVARCEMCNEELCNSANLVSASILGIWLTFLVVLFLNN